MPRFEVIDTKGLTAKQLEKKLNELQSQNAYSGDKVPWQVSGRLIIVQISTRNF